MSRQRNRWIAVLAALTFAVAGTACGDDSGGDETGSTAAGGPIGDVDLTDVCPNPVVVQTVWYAQAEQAAVWQLAGPDGEFDSGNLSYRAPLGDTGIDIEIRTGGPAIGFQPVTSQMYQDDDILLGMVDTDEGVSLSDSQPTVAVVNTLEISPQALMFDPAQHDFESISDIGETDVTVGYFEGSLYMPYLVESGQLQEDQLDGSYDGSPARWLAEDGDFVQQAYASTEPFQYENEIEQWGQPVDSLLIHDAGFEVYAAPLAVRADALEEATPCLEELVPLIQQAEVDYLADPSDAHEAIGIAVEGYGGDWEYSPETAAFGYDKMVELGLMGNGADDTIGNFDLDRVNGVIENLQPGLEAQNEEVPEGLTAEDIVTNEFIDDSIGAS